MRDLTANILAEIAKEENQPIHLVEIALDSGTIYFTDNDSDIEFPTGGQTYTAKGMSFSGINTSLSMEVDEVEVTFDNVDKSMSSYLASDIFQGRYLTIKKVFKNLLADSNDVIILFSGKMSHPRIDEDKFIVKVTSPLDTLKNEIPKRLYQSLCNWEFGGTECGLDITKSPYKETGTADAGSTNSKLIDSDRTEADNYWKYGTLEMTSGDNKGKKREVLSSTSGEINLLYAFPNAINEGDTYSITVGCKKTSLECKNKFNNLINYGGFPTIAKEILTKR